MCPRPPMGALARFLTRARARRQAGDRRARPTRAQRLADDDLVQGRLHGGRRFCLGTRPVIRWIKGDGFDDAVTRAAIGQATRLFGAQADYCLCTQGIDAHRARAVLEWATEPVEWWPVTPATNPTLAGFLHAAGCVPQRFGYWWKWFPARVRPDGPEWILDGDMVITSAPPWFDAWAAGVDRVRVSQDNRSEPRIYGAYSGFVDGHLRLYSGLVSLPPHCHYLTAMARVLEQQPLGAGHDGIDHMCEQGVVAATFQAFDPAPIPLYEFPFGRAFEGALDFGLEGDQGTAWGYHFGNAFRRPNPHFDRLVAAGVVFAAAPGDVVDRYRWLGGEGPWGIPGWAMPEPMVRVIMSHTAGYAGRQVLEVGTSRGRTSAIMASQGCCVTTVDRVDRGARQNLAGLPVEVVIDEAVKFANGTTRSFDLIVCDVHGNSPAEWAALGGALTRRLRPGGTMLVSNAALDQVEGWHEETGVSWFTGRLPVDWVVDFDRSVVPGLAIVRRP